jgi:hypothetical protein
MLFSVVAFVLFLALCAVLAAARWAAQAPRPALFSVASVFLIAVCVSVVAFGLGVGSPLYLSGEALESAEWVAMLGFMLLPAAVSVCVAQALLRGGASHSVARFSSGAAGALGVVLAPFGMLVASCGVLRGCT